MELTKGVIEMNIKQEGYVLMTTCGRFISFSNGAYVFVDDPFKASFYPNSYLANIDVVKAFELWGEKLLLIPTERTINLLG